MKCSYAPAALNWPVCLGALEQIVASLIRLPVLPAVWLLESVRNRGEFERDEPFPSLAYAFVLAIIAPQKPTQVGGTIYAPATTASSPS